MRFAQLALQSKGAPAYQSGGLGVPGSNPGAPTKDTPIKWALPASLVCSGQSTTREQNSPSPRIAPRGAQSPRKSPRIFSRLFCSEIVLTIAHKIAAQEPGMRAKYPMPNGAFSLAEAATKLKMLRLECSRCGRFGRHRINLLLPGARLLTPPRGVAEANFGKDQPNSLARAIG